MDTKLSTRFISACLKGPTNCKYSSANLEDDGKDPPAPPFFFSKFKFMKSHCKISEKELEKFPKKNSKNPGKQNYSSDTPPQK